MGRSKKMELLAFRVPSAWVKFTKTLVDRLEEQRKRDPFAEGGGEVTSAYVLRIALQRGLKSLDADLLEDEKKTKKKKTKKGQSNGSKQEKSE